jgi:NTP pyrophosphatase (non-canonical NTP hydrolase)
MKSLNDLRDEVYANAKAHGFHDVGRTVGDALMLVTTEVGEAYEAFREGGKLTDFLYDPGSWDPDTIAAPSREFKDIDGKLRKPVGVPSEIADVIIRCLDFAGEHGIDIERAVREKMEYNRSRPFKHGNKVL